MKVLSRQFSLDLCDDRNIGHSPKVAAAIEKLIKDLVVPCRGAHELSFAMAHQPV
jgi:hypothetical protein